MQNDYTSVLLDSLEETGVYVITQDTHQILYFNRRVSEVSPQVHKGMVCHELWEGTCRNCPLNTIEGKNSSHTIHYNDPFGSVVDIMANRISWEGIPAFVIIVTPHKLSFEEEQSLDQIEKMYTSSLVTVYDESIIVNLTKDFYLNCQSDVSSSSIPRRGIFEDESCHFAKKTVYAADQNLYWEAFSRESLMKAFGEGKKQVSRRLRRLAEDGSYHMVEFTATRIDELGGDDIWTVIVHRDVQEEYLEEQRTSLELAQLAAAARKAFQVLVAVNLTRNTYHTLDYDQVAEGRTVQTGFYDEMLFHQSELIEPDSREAFIDKFSRQSLLEIYAQGQQERAMELRRWGKDDQYHWYYVQAVRVYSPQTDDVLQIVMCRCVDEGRRIQEENLKKEHAAKLLLEDALQRVTLASRAKSDFLSRMSHDIRTPMNAIMGMAELAGEHLSEPEKLKAYLDKITFSGEHLLGLIDEVLDMNRIESGHLEIIESSFDLEKLMQNVIFMVQPMAQKKQLTLHMKLDAGMHTYVRGDEKRIRQILVNILENGVKYTNSGGYIEVTVQELMWEHKVGTYRFQIKDNGIGMKQEYLEHIFEPFSRADDTRTSQIPGTGLGMTIVSNLVHMMGGTLEVLSEYGQGSRFLITLQLEAGEPKEEEAVSFSGRMEYKGMRILVAEDNAMNREIMEEMVTLLGATADLAEDGSQAVDAVIRHPAGYYDLILMDIHMPVMNGYEAARRIRGLGNIGFGEIPIFALTADAFAEDVKKARDAGMNGHLAKPLSIDRLRSVLENCISPNRNL